MRKLLRRNEELAFTLVAYGLLALVALSFLTVRWTKETFAKLESGPRLLRVYPSSVVPGAAQRVTLLSERTHFGPATTVRSFLPGIVVSNIRFVSGQEMSFDISLQERSDRKEGAAIPIEIWSPAKGKTEDLSVPLTLTYSGEPIELDLFNFQGKDSVTVSHDYVMFGYRPRGYAPFELKVKDGHSGKVFWQSTESEVEHFGVSLPQNENSFELTLSDSLGREVTRRVSVTSDAYPDNGSILASLANTPVCHASGAYTGKPTQWGGDPTEQIPASDCVLGNGPLGCAGGCSSGKLGKVTVRPPPNDYITTLGQAVTGGDTVLLHNGQYREDAVDLFVPGRGLDFVWKRSYQSGINLDGYIGKNWDFSWGAHFIVQYDGFGRPTSGKFSRGDCRRDFYGSPSYDSTTGEYTFASLPQGYFDSRTAVSTGMSNVTQKKRNGFKQIFDLATGNLKSREDRYGNKHTVIYDVSGKLSGIQDTLGRTMTFTYYTSGIAQGRLSKVSDFTAREVIYEYAEAYVGGPIVMTRVNYPKTDWLDDTTNPWTSITNTSRTLTYGYDTTSAARLLTVVDGRGKTTVENVYDVNGRVDFQRNYSSGSVYHDFTWTIASGKVSQVSYKNRSLNERIFYFDTANHLSTRVDVKYTSEGINETATTLITRGCSCTLPTAIQEPDDGYTTFTINGAGDVTEKRQYLDNTPPYSTTAGSDLVWKAYFAPVNSSQYGVVSQIVGPRAFTSTPNENAFAINIVYDLYGNPSSITFPDTTNPTQTGHTETRTYNSQGQLLTISRPEGLLTTLTYYGPSDLPASNLGYLKDVKVKYNATSELITTYTYSNFGAKTLVVDPNGGTTSLIVDNEFLVKQVTSPSPFSYIKKFSYNANRQLVKEELENRKGAAPRDTSNPWWEKQYFVSDGGPVQTKKVEISESGGSVTWAETRYEFDKDFRQTLSAVKIDSAVPPREAKIQYVLDERGLAVTITKAPGGQDESVVKKVFDDEQKLVKTTTSFRNDGDGSDTTVVNRITYDVFDRPEKFLDAATDATSNFKRNYYDLASMVIKVEHYAPDGSDTGTDPDLLRRHEMYFDEMDRLWKRERHLVNTLGSVTATDVTTFEHDKADRRTKTTDDNGNSTKTEFDLADRPTKTIRPSLNGMASGENYELLEYDGNSSVTRRTSHEVNSDTLASEDFVWELAFDEINRMTSSTFKGSDGATGPNPLMTVKMSDGTSGYDSRGLVISKTDVDGVITENVYDGRGLRLTTKHNVGGSNPSPFEVRQQFDLAGNLTAQTDAESPNRNTTAYAYDDQNRRTLTTHQDGDWIEVRYNQLGRRQTKEYGNGGSVLKTIKYDHNALALNFRNRISWTTTPTWLNYDDYKTTQEDFVFDGLYRPTDADDNDTRVTLAWNSLDQITSETLEVNLRSGGVDNWKPGKTTTSIWDDTGRRRTSVTYPISGKKFEYNQDALDRITEIRLDGVPDKPMVRYWYEGAGLEVTKRDRGVDLNAGTPNTFRTLFADDPLNRNTQIKHQRVTSGATDLRILDYTWGNGTTGRIFQRSTYYISDASLPLSKHDYTYDKLGRLTNDKWVHVTPNEDYKYTHDIVQFYQKREKTVNMITTTEREFTKATDGSLQMTVYTNPTTTCTYDVCGNRSTDGSISYYYDHNNRLVFIDGGTDLWYRFDVFGRMVVEKVGSTESLFYYDGLHTVEETNSSLALNRLSLFGVQIDEVLYSGQIVSGNLANHRWPITDHLGSVLVVVDDTAVTKTTYDYTTSFGEAAVGGTETYPYGFTGRRSIGWDVRLYDYRTRAYDPKGGRFMQRDSIGIWGDRTNFGNGYSYTSNNPQNSWDAFGLLKEPTDCRSCCEWVEGMRTKELARAHSDIAQELEDYATIIDKEHLPAARDALNDGVAFGGLHIVGQQVDPIPVVGNNGPIMIPNPAGVAIADVGAAGLIANWARSYWAVSRALFYAVDGGSGWADEARRIEQNCEGRKEYCHKQYSTPEMIITYSVRGQDWDGKEKSFEFTALTVGTDCSCNVNCFVPTGPYDRPRRRP